VAALFLQGTGCGAPAPRGAAPNIVLILTDDQELSSLRHMPILHRRVAREGLTFTRAFVTTPRCCPARASILTGRYAHNHGVLRNLFPDGGWRQFRKGGWEKRSLAVRLTESGYRTALLGKYLNGYRRAAHVPRGWSEWFVMIGKGPYGGFNYRMSENGTPVAYGQRAEDFFTDVLSDKAASFIRRSEEDTRPFFLFVSTAAPHPPSAHAPRDRHAFEGVKAPRPPSFAEADLSDKPRFVREKTHHDDQIRAIDSFYVRYLRSLAGVDRLVGRVLDALEAAGKTEETYLLFTSDNGILLGEHRAVGKLLPYEGAIRDLRGDHRRAPRRGDGRPLPPAAPKGERARGLAVRLPHRAS
jgi:arylsulfatase A-like enzyme